jgi:microcystin-dependent protein
MRGRLYRFLVAQELRTRGSHSHTVIHNASTAAGSSNGVNSAPAVYLLNGATITINGATLPAMSGTAASGGSSTALNKMPPTVIVNYILRVL